MGEGARVLLLEELDHAKRAFDEGWGAVIAKTKRGATISDEFLGGSFTSDAYHMTEPHPEGVVLCIENALAQSGVSKSMISHLLGAAGLVEAVALVLLKLLQLVPFLEFMPSGVFKVCPKLYTGILDVFNLSYYLFELSGCCSVAQISVSKTVKHVSYLHICKF